MPGPGVARRRVPSVVGPRGESARELLGAASRRRRDRLVVRGSVGGAWRLPGTLRTRGPGWAAGEGDGLWAMLRKGWAGRGDREVSEVLKALKF